MVQINKEAGYAAGRYAKLDRFVSYSYQIQEIIATKPASVLEIGVGDGLLSSYFRANSPIRFTTADFAEDLKPDIVADVRNLPIDDMSFDTVCAFQVLEHVPYGEVDHALAQLFRVAKHHVLISLPHFNHPLKLNFKIPALPEVKVLIQVPHPKKHVFDGQHYWEIGKRGYARSKIRALIAQHGTIEKEFVPYENPSHRFFRVKKTV